MIDFNADDAAEWPADEADDESGDWADDEGLPEPNFEDLAEGSDRPETYAQERMFYCGAVFTGLSGYPRLISDKLWISAAYANIKKDGAEQFLVNFLELLRDMLDEERIMLAAGHRLTVEETELVHVRAVFKPYKRREMSLPKPTASLRYSDDRSPWTDKQVRGMTLNPVMAGVGVYVGIVSDGQWVRAVARAIETDGAAQTLVNILHVLRESLTTDRALFGYKRA